MESNQGTISNDIINRKQVIICDDIDLHGLISTLKAPPAITQLEECKFLADTPVCEDIRAELSDPANSSLDVSNRLIVGKQLACGAQADVYEGILLMSNIDMKAVHPMLKDRELFDTFVKNRMMFKKVAVKQRRVYTFLEEANKGAKSVLQELRVWAALDHPNVLRLEGFTFSNGLPVFVSDYAGGGSLTKYRAAHPQLDAKSIAIKLATGLQYLHSRGIIHADLKADNILVSSDGSPMLADFGISRSVPGNGESAEASYEGSLRWMAWELLYELMLGSGRLVHTKESDVWAFGMVLYELMSGKVPLYDKNDAQVMSGITSGFMPSLPVFDDQETLDVLGYLCQKCWNSVASLRLDISQLLTLLQAPVPVDPLDPGEVSPKFKREKDGWLAVYNPKLSKMAEVRLMRTLRHSSIVFAVCFSADGRYVATGCDGMAHIYEMETGEEICVFQTSEARPQGSDWIWSVRFSPDGMYLTTGGKDGLIRIWDIAEKRVCRILKGHTGWVFSLGFSQDGRFVASGSIDQTARIWDMESDEVLILSTTVKYGLYSSVYSVAISPDMQLVAGGCFDNVVRIWNAKTGDLVEVLQGHTDRVRSVAFTPDGKGLVSGSYDKTVKRWDLTRILRHRAHDELFLATSLEDYHLPPALPHNKAISENSESTSNVPIGSAPMCEDGEDGGACTLTHSGHKNYVESVAVSPDGHWVVSGSFDRDVRIWNNSTVEPLMLLRGHTGEIYSVELNPTGDILATASDDETLRLWRLDKV